MPTDSSFKLELRSTFPTVLKIDGVEIDVRVKRMTNIEFDGFWAEFSKYGQPRGPEEDAAARAQREAQSAQWVREVLDEFLTILPGQIVFDGREVVKGGELCALYGGRHDVIPQALSVLSLENTLSESEKKTYRSRLDSRIGSETASVPAASGPAPAAIAPPVDVSSSVENADAMAAGSAA